MHVPLFWVIDIAAERAEVWTPTDAIPVYETRQLLLHPQEVAEQFTLALDDLLAC